MDYATALVVENTIKLQNAMNALIEGILRSGLTAEGTTDAREILNTIKW